MYKKISIIALSAITVLSSFSTLNKSYNKVDIVVIDAGHGGKDPGTHGHLSNEKDVALQIALKLGGFIEQHLPEVKVIYTRDDDNFVELEGRAYIANKNGADLFISIHCNAISNSSVYGTETYVMGLDYVKGNMRVAKRENSVILLEDNYEDKYEGFDPSSPESMILLGMSQFAYRENSIKLASNIERQFKERVGRKSRGVKEGPFWVLWRTSMPSVLVETGFLTNAKEEIDLNDPLKQDYIASGIFRAFRDYKEAIDSTN